MINGEISRKWECKYKAANRFSKLYSKLYEISLKKETC